MAETNHNQPTKKAAPVLALAPDDGRATVVNGKRKYSNWEANHAAIRDAYVRLIGELGRRPTLPEVAAICGLNEKTVGDHVKKIKFEPIAHPLKILSDDVLLAIYKSSVDGNAASQKLWMQIMEGWRESNIVEAQVDHTVSDTKFAVKVHRAGTPKE